jgi:ribonucleotide reductase alpha subunit
MKVRNVKMKQPQWFESDNKISIKTSEGIADVNKFYFNGYAEVLDLMMIKGESVFSIRCTANHKFLTKEHDWVKVVELISGMELTNGWYVESVMATGEIMPTFDIEVPTTHDYVLENGVVTHNSSSIILGNTSPSIEPFKANCYRQDTLSGSYMNKNRYLDQIIKDMCSKNSKLDYQDIWSSIISSGGSIQSLDIFDDWTKSVFKTAIEIDQRWVIDHAADRQQFIDQGQSVNVFFKPDTGIKYLHAVHFTAWKKGLKTLYYCRSEKIIKADKVSQKVERNIIEEIDIKQLAEGGNECLACEG